MTFERQPTDKWRKEIPGTRWFKADLHVHTIDDHPGGRAKMPAGLSGDPADPQTLSGYARRFPKALVKRGVQVVGLTPHSPRAGIGLRYPARRGCDIAAFAARGDRPSAVQSPRRPFNRIRRARGSAPKRAQSGASSTNGTVEPTTTAFRSGKRFMPYSPDSSRRLKTVNQDCTFCSFSIPRSAAIIT